MCREQFDDGEAVRDYLVAMAEQKLLCPKIQ
jgi:hypothetical protein